MEKLIGQMHGLMSETSLVARAWTTQILGEQRGSYSIDSVWNIAFALIFLAILVPIGISQLNATDTGDWTATQVTVWGLIGVIAILVIAYGLYKGVSIGGGGGKRGKRGGGM
jgi:hypothetical protein